MGSIAVLGVIGFAVYQEFGPDRRHHSTSSPGSPTSTSAFDEGPQQDSNPPPGYTIKGNISLTTGEKLYHVPGMRDYEETVIDLDRGERWFRTEQEAVAAGWRRAVPR